MANTCQTVIYLFHYTEYTFVPWRMRLHKKGVSWTWNNIIFIWKHIILWECNRDRCSNGSNACHICWLMMYMWLHQTDRKNPERTKYNLAEGKNAKCFDKYPGGTKIFANSPWLLDQRWFQLFSNVSLVSIIGNVHQIGEFRNRSFKKIRIRYFKHLYCYTYI